VGGALTAQFALQISAGRAGICHPLEFAWAAHHCAVGVGHIASRIGKLGALLSMEVSQVC
jgi:L-arabinose isomerase